MMRPPAAVGMPDVSVCVHDPDNVRERDEAARAFGVRLPVRAELSLDDGYVAERAGGVEALWPITARSVLR